MSSGTRPAPFCGGVTVEAAIPAPIEKVRTAVTENTGQYSIVSLRPGVYTVTFTLTGFTPIKRENVQLTGEQVTTLSVDLRVGDVAETITVAGEAPTVETQSTTKQQVMGNKVIRIGKAIRMNKTRTLINVDLFNLFNANAVTRENPNFAVFRRPTEIMLARFVKVGAQFSF